MFPCKLLVGTFVFRGVGSMTDLEDFFWQKKKKKMEAWSRDSDIPRSVAAIFFPLPLWCSCPLVFFIV